MIPLPSASQLKLGAYLVAAVALFGAGWQIRTWKADAEIQAIFADQAKTEAKQAAVALQKIEQATTTINEAAKRYGAVQSTLSSEIADLKKELQNEPILAVDCKPSAGRVRVLNSAIDSANKASAAGQPAR